MQREAVPDRIGDVWGRRTPHDVGTTWPVRVDSYLQPGVADGDVQRWVPSVCVLCSNGCGIDIAVADDRMGFRTRSGIQWPCNADHPDGAERLYTDASFGTSPDYCETFGHALSTGAGVSEQA